MRRGAKIVLVLVVLFLVLGAAAIAALVWAAGGSKTVPRHTLLEIDFDQPFAEHAPDNPFSAFVPEKHLRLREAVEALHAAAKDDRVTGLVARVNPSGLGLAQVEELRDAVLAFRESGKPAIAYTDTFGEVLPANGAYYLASAFSEIYIQPSGDVGLTGIELTSTFLRGSLEKLGVVPQMAQRHEYKNAMNTFTEKAFTPAHREAMEQLAGSIYDHMTAEIARARKLDPAALRAAIDQGPLLGEEAKTAGLVDGLLYRDEVYERARKLAAKKGEGEPDLLYLRRYWRSADGPWSSGGKTIALVYGVGDVVRGKSEYASLFGGGTMGSDTVSAALRAAAEDDDVVAIVLRIDSPGGSYVASDTIWHEVQRAREKGKPVVASMGELAASGGYFAAMGADKIVAQPSTLTGSIGVLGGKFVTKGLWDKLGLSFDSVQRGEHADMWSTVKEFDPDEWAKFNAWLDRVYADFTTKAAQGRHLPVEKVRELARGHVWTGSDAKRLGLVDELGGYPVALRMARELAKLPADAEIDIREFPRERNPIDELFGEGPENSESEGAEVALAPDLMLEKNLAELQPMIRLLRASGLLGEQTPGALRMPAVGVR